MTWICIWQMSCGGWASLLSGEAAIAGSPWREPWVLFVGCDKRSRFPDGVPARAMNEVRERPRNSQISAPAHREPCSARLSHPTACCRRFAARGCYSFGSAGSHPQLSAAAASPLRTLLFVG
jgi:hypothetical protein